MDNDSDSHGPSPHPQTARAVATLLVSQSRTSTELPGHANSEEALKHNDTTSYAFWNPIWLGRYVLGTFSILFAALSAAIVVLYCISTSKHGLGTYTKRMEVEYFWKYLPTSVTVLLMAVWGQVDYSTRLLQPWENLRKHTAPANRTIFLDLISPMQPVYWASALRHREWAAAITVTVCIALQIARVFSTGLMTLELTELTSNGLVVSKQAEFDPSALNSSDHGNSAGAIYQSIHTANMSYPDWTFEDYALEPFQPIGSVMKRTAKRYAGEVMAFYPWLDCEKVTLKDKWAHPTSYQTSPYVLDITLQSSSCNASTTITLQRIHGGPGGPKDDTYDYYDGVTELVSCGKSQKYLIVVTHGSSVDDFDYSGAICQPNYSLKPLFVKVDNFLQVLTVETRQEKNETDRSFRSSTLDPMDLFQAVLNHSKSVRFPSSSSDNNNGFLKLVSLPTSQGIFEPTAPYMKDLLDTDVLIKQTEATFKGMAVQIAALSLLNPHYKAVNGFVDYEAERLQVKLTSVIAIAICFGLCSILSLFMLCARPWNAAPRDPNSIGGIAAILHSSTQLKSVFKYSLQENKDAFAGQRLIGTIVAETGAYQVSCTGEKDLNQEPSDKKSNTGKKKGWQPLTLNFWSRIATLIVTAAIIIVLEVIQRISNRSHGFTNVASSNLGTAASTYIPTLVMTGVAAMYSSQNFNVVLLSPYRALRTGGSTANRSILSKDLGRLPLFSIFSSAKKGYFASCATAIAAMIGALLTVAVSGLYTLDRVDSPLPISLKRLDRFGTIWDGDVYADNFAGSTLRSIVWQNISYPKWTYGTLAFPSLLIDDVKARERTRLEATLPALRGTLNCTIVDPKEMEYTKQSESSSITLLRLQTLNTCVDDDGAKAPYEIVAREVKSIGGRMSQLDRTLEDGHVLFHGSDSTRFSTVRDISDGCQSLSFYFGDFSQDTPQISAFTCTQQIQEIDTKVNFLLPDFHIDKSNPPVPDESTIRYVGNEATNGSKTFQYPITYSMSNTFEAVADKADNLSPSLGQFYFAVVYGKYGIPANELIGQANIGRLVNATTEMYSLYMAQLLSLKMRETLNASTAQRLSIEQTIQGKLHGNNLRLVQKARPKLALQIMLAVMFVCGVVSWVSLRTTSLLFHDPCSIAGVATLLAGSQLWGSGGSRAEAEVSGPEREHDTTPEESQPDAVPSRETQGSEGDDGMLRPDESQPGMVSSAEVLEPQTLDDAPSPETQQAAVPTMEIRSSEEEEEEDITLHSEIQPEAASTSEVREAEGEDDTHRSEETQPEVASSDEVRETGREDDTLRSEALPLAAPRVEIPGLEEVDDTPSPQREDHNDQNPSLNHSEHESDHSSTSQISVINQSEQSPAEEAHEPEQRLRENQTLLEPEVEEHAPESSNFEPRPNRETRGLLPDGVEWMDDEEMERRGVWKGLVFSLGWWPGGRYGIDVRVPAAASGTSGECR